MLSDNTAQRGLRVAGSGNQAHVVFGTIERCPDVVAHAAVDADVAAVRGRAHGHILDGADPVQGAGAWPRNGPPRLDHQPRGGQADRRRLVVHDRSKLGREVFDRGRIILGTYEIPSPPPRSTVEICAVLSTPNSATTSRSRPITR